MNTNLKISAVIHTFNEESNIRNCLESIKWVDEIIIVDMHSTDRTLNIVKEYTDKVFLVKNEGYADPAREFGLNQTTGDWILSLDADEMVPLALKKKLLEIAQQDLADVIRIPHNNYFFGKHMSGTRWGPLQDTHCRFFKRKGIEFTQIVHDCIKPNKGVRIYKIQDPQLGFVHFNYIDMEHFLTKFNQYTTIEAKNMYEGVKPVSSFAKTLFQAKKEIIGRFVKNKGYQDKMQGFVLSVLMGTYKLVSLFKFKLMKKYKTENIREEIRKEYNLLAKDIIAEYEKDA